MIRKSKRQRAIWMELYGLVTKVHLWICLLMICCDFTLCNGDNGGVGLMLVVTARSSNAESLGRCSDAAVYNQTSWERYESCCQELYPAQTCPLACPCRRGSMCIPSLKQCLCKPGFAGHRCEQPCRSRFNDTWGVNCAKTCKCGPDAVCDQYLGICECIDENRCGQRCKRFRYGPRCERRCKTCQQLGLDCDSYTGQCNLPTIIRDTSDKCGCKNGGRCLANGKCDCYWGFRGTFCQLTCPNNFFGRNCGQHCNCGKNAICTPDVGSCRCREGMGYSCHERCPTGDFGPRCEYQCNCPAGLQCDQQTGDCYPTKGSEKKMVNVRLSDSAPLALPGDRVSVTRQPPLTTKTTTSSRHDILRTTPAQKTTSILTISRRPTTARILRTTTGVVRTTKQTHLDTTSAATTVLSTKLQTTNPLTVKHHWENSNSSNKPVDILSKLSTIIPTNETITAPSDKRGTHPPPSPPSPPTTSGTTRLPTTLPSTSPSTTNKQVEDEQVYFYQIQNGSVPIDIRSQMTNPVITTAFYPSNKLWGVLGMIGFLLVILVILLAFLLLKKQRTLPEVDGKLKRPKRLVQEDNIYETVQELKRNSSLQHPLHSFPPDAPNSPIPSAPAAPRPSTPTSPCPGTPLLPRLGVSALTTLQIKNETELHSKVRQSNDTLPKLPARNASMRTTSQEGVTLRAQMNAKRPRSIHGLSGIQEGDYADAFAHLDPNASARFSFLQDVEDESKKRPFYFTLEADEQNQANANNKGHDDKESRIPGNKADREKTLELAKQGIIYSTVERKRRQKAAQEQSAKNGNYECPMDVVPVSDKANDSALVRVDSKRRVVKEMCTPISKDCIVNEHAYGKLQHNPSDHIYGRLSPSCTLLSGSTEFLKESNGYDQVVRSDTAAKSDKHIVTLEAEVHTENIYDQLDRRNKEIKMDSGGNLQRKDSQRGQITYDRVQRNDSFSPHGQSNSRPRDNRYQYDHVERKGGMFTSNPSDIHASMEDIDRVQENVYGTLRAVNSVRRERPAQSLRRDFGSKLLNRFKLGTKDSTDSTSRKNVTYADFWVDFSFKQKMEEYLRATNSRPVTTDDDDNDDDDNNNNEDAPAAVVASADNGDDVDENDDDDDAAAAAAAEGSLGREDCKLNDASATIPHNDCNKNQESNKAGDGYESVIESLTREPETEFLNKNDDNTTCEKFDGGDQEMEVNLHAELEKRYSKIQEHMQIKFQLQDPCLSEDNEEKGGYAELRSVDEPNTLQTADEQDPKIQTSEMQPYDQLNRTDMVNRQQRSAANAAKDNIVKNDYQQLANQMENASNEYNHLNRTFRGSKSNLIDDKEEKQIICSEDGYGHLVQKEEDSEPPACDDKVSPTLKSSLSLATDDGWVIVPEKDEKKEVKELPEGGKIEAASSKRLPHQYSNTTVYEEIWPGQ